MDLRCVRGAAPVTEPTPVVIKVHAEIEAPPGYEVTIIVRPPKPEPDEPLPPNSPPAESEAA